MRDGEMRVTHSVNSTEKNIKHVVNNGDESDNYIVPKKKSTSITIELPQNVFKEP